MPTDPRSLAEASAAVYNYGSSITPPAGYAAIHETNDPNSGFHGVVFFNETTNEYIAAVTGTESAASDSYADMNLGIPQHIRRWVDRLSRNGSRTTCRRKVRCTSRVTVWAARLRSISRMT